MSKSSQIDREALGNTATIALRDGNFGFVTVDAEVLLDILDDAGRLQRAEELLKEARGFMDDITDVYGPGPDDCKSRIDAFLGEQT